MIRPLITYLLPLALGALALPRALEGDPVFADDAYYYFALARAIVETGESALMAGVPTNGYHPLWLLVLTAWEALVGLDLRHIRLAEIALLVIGLMVSMRALRFVAWPWAAFGAVVLTTIYTRVAMNGMETSLLFPLAAAFLNSAIHGRRVPVLLLTAALTIGARLDAALFVVPVLLMVPMLALRRALVLGGLAVAGGVYVIANITIFGTALPVSGAVKSLGGGALNQLYVDQLLAAAERPITLLLGQPYLTMWLIAAIGLLMWLLGPRGLGDVMRRRVLAGVLIGFALYQLRLLFGSGWALWAWYGYPALLLTIAALSYGPLRITALQTVAALAATAMIGGLNFVYWTTPQADAGYFAMNRAFAEQARAIGVTGPVAMGDRAGSFAWAYDDEVFQMEGLVNSTAYLDVLTAQGDLRAHLCDKGVGYVVDFEPPGRADSDITLQILRPQTTSVAGPTLSLRADEALMSLAHEGPKPADFANMTDDVITLWRLDCGG